MPSISHKGQNMPESPIRKLVPYAEQAKRAGRKIYHLNIGQPDIRTPDTALKAIAGYDMPVLKYSHSAGFESYRQKLSGYYRKNNIPAESDDIIVTTGGSEALLFALSTIADPGDEVIIPEPFYANYNGFAVSSGLKVVPVISVIEDNFALPPISAFENLISPKTKAILICNPGNPTGYLYSKDEIDQLAALAKKHDLFLIADEVYREFVYDGQTHHSVLSVPGLEEHGIVIDSVSKRYSMCGARVGCVVSKNRSVISTAMKFAQARLSPPTLGQIASEAALDTPDSYFKEVNKAYKSRRNTLIDALQEIPGVTVARPLGAFYCIAQLPVDNADDFARWLLEKFHRQNETVMLAPAAGFYATPNTGMNQVRIAYVLKKEDLVRSAEILKAALAEYKTSP